MTLGKGLTNKNPKRVYCGIFEEKGLVRVIIYSGDEASKIINAGMIVREIAGILGGSGGGNAKFAQGGGKDTSKKDEAIAKAKSMILG
jgi:alanyl-tRNA synthetase